MSIRVLLIEDQSLVRESLASLLESTDLFQVVASEESISKALTHLENGVRVDVLLSDYHLRGETAEALLVKIKQWPHIPVVLLTSSVNAMSLQRCRALGARGFLFKESGIRDFISALTAVSEGGEAFSEPDFAGHQDHDDISLPPINLTDVEQVVLRWVASGMSNKQIALATGKSAETIKSHVANVLKKMRCKTRTQAAAKASHYNLL